MSEDSGRGDVIRTRLVRGAISNYAGRLTTLGLWFLLTPMILAYVGPGGYGAWVLAGSLVAYGTLLGFDQGSAIVKFLAEYRARGELARSRRLIATAQQLYLLLGLVAVLIGIAIMPVIPAIFGVPMGQRDEVSTVVLLTALMLGAIISGIPVQATLGGLHRYDLYNTIEVAASLIWGMAVVVALVAGWGVTGIIAVNIPIIIAMRVITVWAIRRTEPDLYVGWSGADRSMVRTLVQFNAFVLASQVSDRLKKKTDELIVGAFLSVVAVAPYSVARKASELAFLLSEQLVRMVLPLASELHAQRDPGRLRTLYIVATRATIGVSLPTALVLLFLTGPLLTLWVGAEYVAVAPLVAILLLASLASISAQPAVALLQGMGRIRLISMIALTMGLINLSLSVALVGPFGLLGVALGTLIPAVAEAFIFIIPIAMRSSNIGARMALRAILIPVLVPAVPMVLVMYGAQLLLGTTTIFGVAWVGGGGLLAYAVAYLCQGVAHRERELVAGVFRRLAHIRGGDPIAKHRDRP